MANSFCRAADASTDHAVTLPCVHGADSGSCRAGWHGDCFYRGPADASIPQENTMSRPRILVINPNSNPLVTQGLEDALKPLGFAEGPEIVCETLTEGPYGIESQADADSVTMPLRRLVESDNRSAAFIIACYSDPGLHVCREGTDLPVFGIAADGVLTALALAETFGVIAIAQRAIRRHMRCPRQMELISRLTRE